MGSCVLARSTYPEASAWLTIASRVRPGCRQAHDSLPMYLRRVPSAISLALPESSCFLVTRNATNPLNRLVWFRLEKPSSQGP